MINTEALDRYYNALLTNKRLELDLRQLCGRFVNFTLNDYTVTADHDSRSVNQILDHYQSKLNLKHKQDKGYYRTVMKV